MTTIIDAMQNDDNFGLRLSCGDRWMVGDKGGWSVYERKAYARNTTVVYAGDSESAAVAALLGE